MDVVASIHRSPYTDPAALMQLGGCAATAAKSPNASVDEMEHRHEEVMRRMGGGSADSM